MDQSEARRVRGYTFQAARPAVSIIVSYRHRQEPIRLHELSQVHSTTLSWIFDIHV